MSIVGKLSFEGFKAFGFGSYFWLLAFLLFLLIEFIFRFFLVCIHTTLSPITDFEGNLISVLSHLSVIKLLSDNLFRDEFKFVANLPVSSVVDVNGSVKSISPVIIILFGWDNAIDFVLTCLGGVAIKAAHLKLISPSGYIRG